MLHATLCDALVPHLGVLFVVRRMPFAYCYVRDICYMLQVATLVSAEHRMLYNSDVLCRLGAAMAV